MIANQPLLEAQPLKVKARWLEAAKRRRLLDGKWLEDLEQAILREVGKTRRRYWGAPDISKNAFRDVVTQLSVLYDSEGTVANEQKTAAEDMHNMLESWWPFMREHQKYVEGLRECLLKVDFVKDDDTGEWSPLFTTITPDVYDLEFDKRNPTKVVKVTHWVERTLDGEPRWLKDVWSIKEGDRSYSVLDEKGTDYSSRYLSKEQMEGWGDYLPFVHYHAAITGKNFNTSYGSELVCLTYKVGVFWSYWGYLLKNCSHPARYGINARLVGTAADESTGSEYADAADPSVFLNFKTHGNNPGSVGQFNPGGDPKSVGESIISYTAEGLSSWGIAPAENMRVSADPRSGFAIALSRETIREHQAKATPAFRSADLKTLKLVSRMSNEAFINDSSLPLTGWSITYRGIPPSAQEQAGKLDHDRKRVELKQVSYAELLSEDTGLSLKKAQKALLKKQSLNNELGTPKVDPTASLAASTIVKDFHLGQLPLEGAKALLKQFFNLSEESASAMLAGKSKTEVVSNVIR